MRKNSATSIMWGLILVILGIGFFLDNLNVLGLGDFFRLYWPVALILIALGRLIEGRTTSALIWAVLGIVFQLNTLGYIGGNVWSVIFSFLLILIGLNIIFRREVTADKVKSDYVSTTGVFGGGEKRIDSENFTGASINAIFGGAKLDLREAKIAKEGAVIDVMVLFGGGEIIVPENASVKMDVFAIFGGSDDKRVKKGETSGPRITVRGMAVFGGLEVKN